MSLLTNLLENFVSKKSLYSYADGSCKVKNVLDLVQLNLEKKENLKPSNFVDVETKAKTIICDFDDEKNKISFIPLGKNVTLHLFHIFRPIYHLTRKSSSILNTYLHPQKRKCLVPKHQKCLSYHSISQVIPLQML